MNEVPLKIDNIGDSLPATDFNAYMTELENYVKDADITLDPTLTVGGDVNMLGKAGALYASAGMYYTDSGVADAYVLTRPGNLQNVASYKDGMMIVCKATNNNTGASTVNVGGLGVKNIQLPDGSSLPANKILSGEYFIGRYNLASDRFEFIEIKQDNVSIRDIARNLSIINNSVTPNSKMDVDADEIILQNTAGVPFRASTVNLTIDITVSGANGLDTGAEAISTWYYIWVIHNPSTNTTAGIFSTSSTAPTMPSGYTFKSLTGAIFNNSSSNFTGIDQQDRIVRVTNPVTALLTAGTATTFTAVSLTNAVPTTAKEIDIQIFQNSTQATSNIVFVSTDQWNNTSFGIQIASVTPPVLTESQMTVPIKNRVLEYKSGNANNAISFNFRGWRY